MRRRNGSLRGCTIVWLREGRGRRQVVWYARHTYKEVGEVLRLTIDAHGQCVCSGVRGEKVERMGRDCFLVCMFVFV